MKTDLIQTVALLTDYGVRDAYVAVLKAVLIRHAPQARLVDITHEVPPGDVRAGAFILEQCWQAFAQGTVFLGVVDPGVGGARKALAGCGRGRFFSGPDNGLFGFLAEDAECVSLDPAKLAGPPPSATFHGRDLFAPACGMMAAGAAPADLGVPCENICVLASHPPVIDRNRARAAVVYVDRFGNAVTNLARTQCEARWKSSGASARAGGRDMPLVDTYCAVPEGAPLAYFGSGGFLEIGVNRGHAASMLKLQPGSPVELMP